MLLWPSVKSLWCGIALSIFFYCSLQGIRTSYNICGHFHFSFYSSFHFCCCCFVQEPITAILKHDLFHMRTMNEYLLFPGIEHTIENWIGIRNTVWYNIGIGKIGSSLCQEIEWHNQWYWYFVKSGYVLSTFPNVFLSIPSSPYRYLKWEGVRLEDVFSTFVFICRIFMFWQKGSAATVCNYIWSNGQLTLLLMLHVY